MLYRPIESTDQSRWSSIHRHGEPDLSGVSRLRRPSMARQQNPVAVDAVGDAVAA